MSLVVDLKPIKAAVFVILFTLVYQATALATSSQCATATTSEVTSQEYKEERLLDSFFRGSKDLSSHKSFFHEIETSSETERQGWLKALIHTYREHPKLGSNGRAVDRTMIGGRRLADHMIGILQRADLYFKKATDSGQSPKSVYEVFLKSQIELFESNYKSEQVFLALNKLQELVREFSGTQLWNGSQSTSLVVAGSFINGKARFPGSDIDVSTTNMKFEKFLQNEGPNISKSLSDETSLPLKFEAHLGNPPDFYGKYNPVVFKITSNKVEMYVFPPMLDMVILPGERTSQTPQIYSFE